MEEHQMRIGDTERDETVSLLSDHFAAGRLTRTELDQRTAQALDARTRDDLDRVMVDLPAVITTTPPTAMIDLSAGSGDEQRRVPALWRRTVLVPWAVFGVFFIVLWALTGAGYFWPIWPILGWGIAVTASGITAHTNPTKFLTMRQDHTTASPQSSPPPPQLGPPTLLP